MVSREELGGQLRDELDVRFIAYLAPLLGPQVYTAPLRAMIDSAADSVAIRLLDEPGGDSPDDLEAHRTAVDVMNALWGGGTPDDDWWRTPLGRTCAKLLDHDSAEAITYQRAALMLGITRGSVSQMVARGTLARHPDGGVRLSSVLGRLGRGRERKPTPPTMAAGAAEVG